LEGERKQVTVLFADLKGEVSKNASQRAFFVPVIWTS
jgi:hypothetical protein